MPSHSSRLPSNLTPSVVAEAVAARRRSGAPLFDLTESNPTRVGLAYPPDLLAPLADPAALVYDPQPLGLRTARAAVSADFERRGIRVPDDRVAITASTSEAYALLFKLLCGPGDQVLVPRPSYPLFEHLTALEAVEAVPYDLEYHDGWRLDLDNVRAQVSSRTRAILVVSPNNPTGSYLHQDDLAALVGIAAARDLAIIGDEVFWDYPLQRPDTAVSVLAQQDVVAVGLGGLSKSAGLPQVKLGWFGMSGPDAQVRALLDAYEIVADTYLSVSTPVQVAAPALIEAGAGMRRAIQARLDRNLTALGSRIEWYPSVTLLPPEGGWSAVLQVPAYESEEAMVVGLIEREGVLVHPGYFFDFAREAFLVVSLLPEAGVFDHGLARVLARMSGAVGR
ncbi:MAG: pyridoxal phosphate-dependent aminotransferase [Vicinamibacterales bacterium]|nr:pyridoxal phosphate-dependent aminotransferase [Vicinamibacterales bacterium]